MSDKNSPFRPDNDLLVDLNFVPKWAKKDPGSNHYRDLSKRETRYDNERRPKRPRPNDRRRAPREQRSTPREYTSRPERKELPIAIKFLPEQKRLGSLVRQIHHSCKAYPLIDLAHIFLSDPRGHMVKLEITPNSEDFKLFQSKKTKMVATDRDGLVRQLIENHLEDFFEKQEIETEPPSGNFPMIAKIGDVLIAPPNHHSYNDRLEQVYRTRYSDISLDQFKQRIETVKDDDLVEQWKQEASKKTTYRLIDSTDEREFSFTQAGDYIRTHVAPDDIEDVNRAVIPSNLARKIDDANLIRMVREAWQKESRFPISLAFSLRAAFRHLHLHIFKAGKNIQFVTGIKPEPLSLDGVVEDVRVILEYLMDHPGSTRKQLVEGLLPNELDNEQRIHEIQKPIHWLVEKGHVIEFFNGTLSVPSAR